MPITGMGSLNSSFHFISAVLDTLRTLVLTQQFRLLGGAALSSPRKTGTTTVKAHRTSSTLPILPSRAESKAASSVLLFMKVEQDTLLPCSVGETGEEADQQYPSSVILSTAHRAEVLARASAARAGTVPHTLATW